MSLKAIFFDIGNTLGKVDLASRTLTPFAEVERLLESAGKVFRVPVGVISNVPDDWKREDVEGLLHGAGLLKYLDARGIVTSVEAQASKPDSRIFQYAAQQFQVKPSECLFIDDDANNVTGASDAGMSAIQKVWP